MQVVCGNCQLSFQAPEGAAALMCPICRSPLRPAQAAGDGAANKNVIEWEGGALDDLMGRLGSSTVKLVSPAVNRENLDALLALLESGEVRVVIDKTYPLDQAAGAVTHMLEHHPSGKIAITA